MTTALAIEYIPRRMRDLGHGDNYYLRLVHFRLQAGEIKTIDATGGFYILVEEPANVVVESDMGVFNTTITAVNELQYEHQGQITITNSTATISSIRFIQVIPKTKKQKKEKHGHKRNIR